MSDKERLERLNNIKIAHFETNIDLSFDTVSWLIKQAGRVQELERQSKRLELEVVGWFNKAQEIHESMIRQDKVIDKFRQQNKRYREAIIEAINENGSVRDRRFMVNQILEEALEESE